MFTVNTERALQPYRDAFGQMAIGAVVVPQALTNLVAADIRRRLRLLSFTPYRLVHRGHYGHSDDVDEPALLAAAVDLAAFITDSRLVIRSQRCYRLSRGDYVLSAADPAPAAGLADDGVRLVDVTIDLSEGSSGEAQVVYAHRGDHFFAAPQLSRSIAVVERRPSVTRYHRYLNHLVGERVIFRLCLTLGRPEVAPTDPPPTSKERSAG